MKYVKKNFVVLVCLLCLSVVVPNNVIAQASDVTTSDSRMNDSDDDDNGNWGLLGLIGLAGLIGLKGKDNDKDRMRTSTTTGTGNPNR